MAYDDRLLSVVEFSSLSSVLLCDCLHLETKLRGAGSNSDWLMEARDQRVVYGALDWLCKNFVTERSMSGMTHFKYRSITQIWSWEAKIRIVIKIWLIVQSHSDVIVTVNIFTVVYRYTGNRIPTRNQMAQNDMKSMCC